MAPGSAGSRPKTARLVSNQQLREYVQDRLAGVIRLRLRHRVGAGDSMLLIGPPPPGNGSASFPATTPWPGPSLRTASTCSGQAAGI
jgi:hypothetical protein